VSCTNVVAAEKPNTLLILVDDLGWMDLSCQGSDYYKNPAIDQVAAEGMRFTDGYAAWAVCSPTRAAVQTGRYPHRVGVTDRVRARLARGPRRPIKANSTQYVGGANKLLLRPPNPFWMEHEEITIAEVNKQPEEWCWLSHDWFCVAATCWRCRSLRTMWLRYRRRHSDMKS